MPILNYRADLSKEEMEDPAYIVKSFLADTNVKELRILFSDILETCLTSGDLAFNTGKKRFNLIINLRNIECFIQAVGLFIDNENDSYQS